MNQLPVWATASASAMPPNRTHRTVTPPEIRSPALRSHERAALCPSGHPSGEQLLAPILAARTAGHDGTPARESVIPLYARHQAPAPSEIGASTTPNDGARQAST
jgi:hypothetical protein